MLLHITQFHSRKTTPDRSQKKINLFPAAPPPLFKICAILQLWTRVVNTTSTFPHLSCRLFHEKVHWHGVNRPKHAGKPWEMMAGFDLHLNLQIKLFFHLCHTDLILQKTQIVCGCFWMIQANRSFIEWVLLLP